MADLVADVLDEVDAGRNAVDVDEDVLLRNGALQRQMQAVGLMLAVVAPVADEQLHVVRRCQLPMSGRKSFHPCNVSEADVRRRRRRSDPRRLSRAAVLDGAFCANHWWDGGPSLTADTPRCGRRRDIGCATRRARAASTRISRTVRSDDGAAIVRDVGRTACGAAGRACGPAREARLFLPDCRRRRRGRFRFFDDLERRGADRERFFHDHAAALLREHFFELVEIRAPEGFRITIAAAVARRIERDGADLQARRVGRTGDLDAESGKRRILQHDASLRSQRRVHALVDFVAQGRQSGEYRRAARLCRLLRATGFPGCFGGRHGIAQPFRILSRDRRTQCGGLRGNVLCTVGRSGGFDPGEQILCGRHECGRLPRLIDSGLQVGDQAVGQEMAACIVRCGFQ
ncbi:hypothetical protein ACFJIW_14975 [Tahibacter sp. UC22_41]|uniref:hypothetical protein n=1 Tax=Tahibacter sp. UC22_41 TaxID=3350178 RepID=UPI0036DB92D4